MAITDHTKKLLRGCVAAFALAAGGTSVAQAQSSDANFALRAALDRVEAEARADKARCRSSMMGDYGRGLERAVTGTAAASLCTAEAEAERLENSANAYYRHDMTSQYYQLMNAAIQARGVANKERYEYRVTECNVRLADRLGRSNNSTWDNIGNMADRSSCKASATEYFYRDEESRQYQASRLAENYSRWQNDMAQAARQQREVSSSQPSQNGQVNSPRRRYSLRYGQGN